jgi:hypothetical protein
MTDFANTLNERVIRHRGVGPDCGEDLILQDQAASVLGEKAQYGEALWPKPDFVDATPQRSSSQIDREPVEVKRLLRGVFHRSSQGRLPHAPSL